MFIFFRQYQPWTVKFRTYIHTPARTDNINFMKITKKLDEKQDNNFEAIVVAKDELELKDVVYGIFTKDYLQDELFDKESINEQLKILLPEHSIIKYIETYNANKVEIFSFSVNTIIKEPKDLFNIFTNINSELYSITISKPILMKNTNLGIEVDFIIEFNQLKN